MQPQCAGQSRTTPQRGESAVGELLDAAGLPTELGALDYLLHRGEANPRTRSGIMYSRLP